MTFLGGKVISPDGVWKYVKPSVFGSKLVWWLGSFISSSENWPQTPHKITRTLVFECSCQLLLNKFFDPCTPSKKKVDNEGKNILFRGVICCWSGLYAVQEGNTLFRRVILISRRVVYCSGGQTSTICTLHKIFLQAHFWFARYNSQNSHLKC